MKLTRLKVYVPVAIPQGMSLCLDPQTSYEQLFATGERLTAFGSQEEAIESKRPQGLICGQSATYALVRISYCSDLQRALSGMVPEKRTANGEPFIKAGERGQRLISLEGMKEIVNHPQTHVWMKPFAVQI